MKKNEFFRENFTQRRKDAENAEEEKRIGIFINVQLCMKNIYFFFASFAPLRLCVRSSGKESYD